ncbi:T9SS type B sorting domain-containing protein [Winogradskyella litoriviva]|uniref:T9SS type B sorting domain-containing protein n=1 Tax=Winogradskyella litoriviva TaxID=1220182 RepID=A0ABX2E777_9FLAO|nr:T9SS type B sorting domain-containing protein [Winogradskyella litoriviva]NRD24115.1 T9SS type B sorting domain-containing protein [Winogradskyella litoriviva]
MYSNFPQKYYSLFCLILLCQFVNAQLSDFSFSVTTTDESCAGNGSISMEVSGITTGADITYTLFLYPDIITPIAQTSANSFNNLENGDYLVQALQTLDDLQNSQSADAIINDEISVLDFEIEQGFSGACGDAILIVDILSGNAEFFEIISGPVTVPLQMENTFNSLTEGTYIIRVFDVCGNALTKTYTFLFSDVTFTIVNEDQPNVLNSCEETTINQIISAGSGSVLSYPITVNYTISLIDGSDSTSFSQTYETGSEQELEISETITNYDNDQAFIIETVVQDGCGDIVSSSEIIDPNPQVTMTPVANVCGSDLIIVTSNMVAPYTLQFIDAPDEFDPSDYNDNDGVYTDSVIVFEQEDLGLPYGIYSVSVIDACNRVGLAEIELIEEPVELNITATNGGCDALTGQLSVSVPNREIEYAIFNEAPEAYTNAIPDDVSDFISTSGTLEIDELPKGTYILEIIDNCGSVYIEEIEIPDLEEFDLNVSTSVSCSSDVGSLRIAGSYGTVTSVFVIEAPTAFSQSLPFDYSSAIEPAGFFFVDDLPAGDYTIEFTDSCGNEFMFNQTIESYAYGVNDSIYNLQRNCGSFDLGIMDTDDSVANQTYWFQKYYPESDSWGHPETGVLYNEGDLPNTSNAIEFENGESLINIFFVGTFRLIKAFQSINTPNLEEYCLDIFGEFEVGSDLIINDVFNLNCEGGLGPSDILVDVIGVPPYNFSIVSPINIDNGNDNIFSDLSPGVYEIQVEDSCGSIEVITVNSLDLLPVVNLGIPSDLVICNEEYTNQGIFDLSQQNSQLLGNQNPENFTITYHLSQIDADSGNNPISETYENVINPQTIYVRMIHNTLDVCYETDTFQIIVGTAPQLGPDESVTICEGAPLLLSADSGYNHYLWSSGETTRNILAQTAGTYSVTVSNEYNGTFCDATKNYTVNVSSLANIDVIITEDFSSNGNSIDVDVIGLGDYEYSLDGLSYQSESYFLDLPSGDYTVFVRDRNGCGVNTKNISLLNYKKFFTPNGDTYNEYWHISGAQFEPDLQVYIYNRYGKLLTSFSGNQIGWDGSYNGKLMPTSDYWFVVERTNGLIHTGHFTLKR